MLSTLFVVLPIFALIFAGWLVRRIGVLGPNATSELNRFVVYLALPALLFDIVANAQLADLWQPGFVGAFGLGAGAVFCCTLALRLGQAQRLADAAIDGLNASYANTGFVGFPLVLVALGNAALPATLVATIITVCVLFGVAIVLIEVNLQTETRGMRLLAKVLGSLLRNPLLIAPLLGTFFPLTGTVMPAPVQSFFDLVGAAASPCALVGLGLFLAGENEHKDRQVVPVALLVAIKLVVHPVVTWILATAVFRLSPLLTYTAVLLAALPTGTGPFMLAEFYRRQTGITSKVVLISTVVSIATISVYLALIG